MANIEYTRRAFLISLGAAASAYVTKRGVDFLRQIDSFETDLKFLDALEPCPNALPRVLTGTCLNTPFLWSRRPDYIDYVLSAARSMGVTNLRMFITDAHDDSVVEKPFEETLGDYTMGVIDGIEQLSEHVRRNNERHRGEPSIGLTASLFDAYSLLHSDKPNSNYNPTPLSSPYLTRDMDAMHAQQAFFTKPVLRGYFRNRMVTLITHLQHCKSIVAWEVANELEVPGVHEDDARSLLTNWYQEMVPYIEEIDRTRPIITGLAKPWFIDETALASHHLVNSAHIYIGEDERDLRDMFRFVRTHRLPLVINETGIARTSLGGSMWLPGFVARLLHAVSVDSTLHASQIGFWKLDAYHDNFSVDPALDPGTAAFIHTLSAKLARIYTNQGLTPFHFTFHFKESP